MSTQLALAQVQDALTRLGMTRMAEVVPSYAEQAASSDMTYLDFLVRLLDAELEHRYNRYLLTRLSLAHFPYRKTLSDFDFSFQPSIDERQVRELATLSFVDNGTNVILLGPPGVGKTHLAVAIGMEAVTHRVSVYFVTMQALVSDLRRAHNEGRLERRLRLYTRPKLLICDEMGYLPLDSVDAANFFRLVSERYEKGAMIITSNTSYANWGKVFGDPVLAAALLDRLLHHSVTINIRGNSYRMKEKLKAGFVNPFKDEATND